LETGTAWRAPTRRRACYFIFASYTARRLVGISVGIGSNRRRQLLYQMVMAVVEYRPGAPFLMYAIGDFDRRFQPTPSVR
jgi:hypothetical protein